MAPQIGPKSFGTFEKQAPVRVKLSIVLMLLSGNVTEQSNKAFASASKESERCASLRETEQNAPTLLDSIFMLKFHFRYTCSCASLNIRVAWSPSEVNANVHLSKPVWCVSRWLVREFPVKRDQKQRRSGETQDVSFQDICAGTKTRIAHDENCS